MKFTLNWLKEHFDPTSQWKQRHGDVTPPLPIEFYSSPVYLKRMMIMRIFVVLVSFAAFVFFKIMPLNSISIIVLLCIISIMLLLLLVQLSNKHPLFSLTADGLVKGKKLILWEDIAFARPSPTTSGPTNRLRPQNHLNNVDVRLVNKSGNILDTTTLSLPVARAGISTEILSNIINTYKKTPQ
ncbi:MAG: hypothetical protein JWM96_873 [Alphaproteobacteria bacterium]|nr:hypothetical protein [Alphaproteobacteria bacterium]